MNKGMSQSMVCKYFLNHKNYEINKNVVNIYLENIYKGSITFLTLLFLIIIKSKIIKDIKVCITFELNG